MRFETIILVLLGGILSYQDILERRVSLYVLLLYALWGIFFYGFQNICIWPPIIILSLGIGYYIIKKKAAFGMADYILVIINSLVISNNTWDTYIIFMGVYGLIFGVFFRKYNNIPFVPVILLATVTNKLFFMN